MTTRWHWGYGIAAVYIAFAGCTIGFVMFAMEQPVDLVSRDYYEQSLVHDAHRAALDRAARLTEPVTVDAAGDGRTIVLSVPAPAAASARGRITLYRPASSGDDRTWDLALDRSHRQRIDTTRLPRGRWTFVAAWSADGLDYQIEEPITLP